jgi:hypothetical protein
MYSKAYTALNHANFSFKVGISEEGIRASQIFYRAIQIHHHQAMDCINFIMTPWMFFTFGTAVPLMYVFIGAHTRIGFMSKAWILSTLFGMGACFKIVCKVAHRYSDASKDYSTSFLTHVGLNEVDAAFFKSCPTLLVEVPHIFIIEQDTPLSMGQIILSNVIDLLLTFPAGN